MNLRDTNLLSLLYTLLQTCNERQESFQCASEEVEDNDLKYLFSSYSLQRAKFAGELQIILAQMRELDEEDHGGHRLDQGPRHLVIPCSADTRSILASCARAEETAIEGYRKVLRTGTLSDPIREVVARQQAEMDAACCRIRHLLALTGAG